MLTKPCGREACVTPIRAKWRSELRRRKFCSHRCANRVSSSPRCRALQDKSLWRACVQIQKALGIEGSPSPELVRVVRRLRRTAYQAGWGIVVGKVRRAVARGVLVRPNGQKALA